MRKIDQIMKIKEKQTKKMLESIESEFSMDKLEIEVEGYPRFIEVKFNRDRLTINKPEGVKGDIIISLMPRPCRKKSTPLKFKIHFPKKAQHKIDVPHKYLSLLAEKCSSKKRTDLFITIDCADLGIKGELKVHFNPKLI